MEFTDSILVMAIIAGSIILFVSDRFPIDGVAFLVLLALLLTGIVPPDRILEGFSNPATITVAAMFVLSAGLQRTGVIRYIAQQLHRPAGRGATRLNLVLGHACGALSAFINNTATVAVLLPVALNMCKERNISPARVLMPLSFAAQFGGVCTLIGTTTNLLVNAYAVSNGLEPFSMFEFAKLGLILFVVGMVYMLIASRFMLHRLAGESEAFTDYRLQDYLTEMKVMEGSPLIGQTGAENDLNELGENLRILEIIRDDRPIWAPQTTQIHEGDILLIRGDIERVMSATGRLKLTDWAEGNLSETHLKSDDVTLMEVMIPAGSHLIGRSLSQLDFYWRYHAAVLGVRRRGEILHERMSHIIFKDGDTLLLQGHRADLNHLDDETDFVLLKDLSTLRLKKRRALMSVLILLGVVALAATGITSILTAALLGAAAMVIARCINMQEAYASLDMKVLILLAGLIPLGIAMQTTGTALWLVESLLEWVGDKAPVFVLGSVYVLTMVLTAFMSNNATALLLAPLAVGVASTLGVDSKPFLMAVTFAASTCFMTPVGYQTNLMVYAPGNYRYVDFFIVGLPLNIIFFVISVTLIPVFWPF